MQTFEVLQQLYAAEDEAFVAGLFREFLDTDPDPTIFGELIDSLRSGGTRDEALDRIIQSSLFERLFSEMPPLILALQRVMAKEGYEFVRSLMIEVTGLEPSFRDLQDGFDSLTAGNMTKLALLENWLSFEVTMMESYVRQPESAGLVPDWASFFGCADGTFVLGLYQELLNREPSWEELTLLSQELISGQSRKSAFEAVLRGPEFAGLALETPVQARIRYFQAIRGCEGARFVAEVYRDCLGREPDYRGLDFYAQQLGEGASRLEVLRLLLLSHEAKERFRQGGPVAGQWPVLIEREVSRPHRVISEDLRERAKQTILGHGFPETTAILVKTGGLADFVQMTAVANALKRQNPGRPVIAAIGSACGIRSSLFEENPCIDRSIEFGETDMRVAVKSLIGLTDNVFDLRSISHAYGTWRNAPYFYENSWYYDYFPYSGCRVEDLGMHVCDLMLHSLGLEDYATCNDVLIVPDVVPEEIPGDYVVVCNSAGGAQGVLRQWSREEWDGLIQWLLSQRFIPVQLGLATDLLLHPGVMDLRGKTTPRQAAGYLKHSKGYVGIEGGLYNLAEAVKAPAVVIFAATSETCFAYPGTRVVTRRLCRPCWWTENAWERGICPRGRTSCLNLPDWGSVAREVSEMLSGFGSTRSGLPPCSPRTCAQAPEGETGDGLLRMFS